MREKPLRAIIEIFDGELVIYPIGDSDAEREIILRALRKLNERDKR